MSSPPVRPNWGNKVCRGEPAGKVTNVGHSVTLGFTITAPHVGMCTVYILDENLGNSQKIAEKLDCAATGKVGPWTINIPSNISGRKVIRWYWEAAHVTPHEPYENCADVIIGSGGGSPQPETTGTPTPAPAPAPTATSPSYVTAQPTDTAGPSSGATLPSSNNTNTNNTNTKPSGTTPSSGPSSNNTNTGTKDSNCDSKKTTGNTGQYTCNSNGQLGQCNYGAYTWFNCSKGTTCRNSGNYYYCGY
ncbi:hypothetical protein BDF22DRAFT_695649 [Syncephalis plumigaleata]|nr:hypothetical protein BDF22DRAFT_695649 [Syncephalis plumigaleata]